MVVEEGAGGALDSMEMEMGNEKRRNRGGGERENEGDTM